MSIDALEFGDDLNLADQAYEQLRRLILMRQLPGGTFVVEGKLAEQLHISRTPMREAILRLAAEGLLVKHGSRSFAVRRVTPTEFFQAMRVRELLECEAIRLAMGKIPAEAIAAVKVDIARLATAQTQERAHWDADDRMHLMFPDASGNEVLGRLIRQIRVTTRLFEISSPFRRVKEDGAEHLAILKAYAKGDVAATVEALRTHIRNLSSDAMAIISGAA
ncbi:GntR family transcriptional regulator [Acidisphaera sp. L21]|uniref:GntR family transcriptional regulator n=1 Tax=Acidisphaera sp. L21 TaxID=1641851 RepID=UPI00131E1526|nr:GntR family transcriptional regulator [Acidisphaera sp. L21]